MRIIETIFVALREVEDPRASEPSERSARSAGSAALAYAPPLQIDTIVGTGDSRIESPNGGSASAASELGSRLTT
jgi:hypothetical protein